MSNWYSKVQTRYQLWKTAFVPSTGNVCLRNWFLSAKLFGGSTEDHFSPGFRKPPFAFGFHQWRIFWYYCFSLVSEKFDLRFTEVIGSEQQVWVPKCLDWRAFATWQYLLLDSKSAARAAVACRGHSCSANLADTITLFCNYTDNNNPTLKLLDKALMYMGQHSLASPRHKGWEDKPCMCSQAEWRGAECMVTTPRLQQKSVTDCCSRYLMTAQALYYNKPLLLDVHSQNWPSTPPFPFITGLQSWWTLKVDVQGCWE